MVKMVKGDMHGLSLFISDLRNCKSPEDEKKRINKELANIRSNFNGVKTLDGYQKKKYLCKLIFIFLLGHDIDIGVLEAINSITSNKFSEKFIGYLFLSVIMHEKSNLMLMARNSIKSDLASENYIHQNLALQYAANMANEDIVNDISVDVIRIIRDNDTQDSLKQSAVLCLLQIFRVKPDAIPNEKYIDKVVTFISHSNLGLVTSATSLLEVLAEKGKLNGYPCVSNIVSKLDRIVKANPSDLPDYTYYFVPAPWLIVKLLRLLRKFSTPPDSVVRSRLLCCIELILNKCQEPLKSKKLEHRNARNAIIFETILLIYHIKDENNLLPQICNFLDLELKRRESNSRYLALETMCLLTEWPAAKKLIKKQLESIQILLYSEADNGIRKRASDLIFALCDENNLEQIIFEMVNYFHLSDDSSKEEVALKIAAVADQFCNDTAWYVDIVLCLLRNFGDYVKSKIWFTLIGTVLKYSNVHSYLSKRVFEIIQPFTCNENSILVASYILGEFGHLIAGDPISNSRTQLHALHKHFHSCCLSTKACLFTTYVKFSNMFPDIKEDVRNIFMKYVRHADLEIQKRAVEYIKLIQNPYLGFILNEIPLPERPESLLKVSKQAIKPKLSNTLGTESKKSRKIPTLKKASSESFVRWETPFVEETLKEKMKSTLDIPQKSYCEILADIFSRPPSPVPPSIYNSPAFEISTGDSLSTQVWQNNGVLLENDFLRVLFLCEFEKNKGRVLLRYRNKSTHPLRNFLPSFLFQDVLKWKLEMKPCLSVIFPNEETEQEILVECLQEFCQRPALSVGFDCYGNYCEFPLKLPITLNKFFTPAVMDASSFRQRWANFNDVRQEMVKVFDAKLPINSSILIKKLNGMGIAVLANISQNPRHIFGAGIFHCRAYDVGFLCHLQLQSNSRKYCLKMRSRKETILEEIARLVECLI